MAGWTAEELTTLDRVREIRVAGRRRDGTLRSFVIVWHVVVDGALFLRSVRGTEGQWYRGVARHFEGAIRWDGQTREVSYALDSSRDAEIDAAYTAKYGTGASVRAITTDIAKETSLRVDPR